MVRTGQACGSKLDWHRLGRSRSHGRIHQGRLLRTFQLRNHHGVLLDGDDVRKDGRPALRRIYGRLQSGILHPGDHNGSGVFAVPDGQKPATASPRFAHNAL